MSQIIFRSIGACLLLVIVGQLRAQENAALRSGARNSATVKIGRSDDTPARVLSSQEWQRVDRSVDRGLAFLASQQQPDGSFPTLAYAQPGVTSLCVLAFMAHGHSPGSGPYGERLERAVKFIVDCQKPSGLIMLIADDEPQINRNIPHDVGVAGTYDHAISTLTLSELFGMNPANKSTKLKNVINKSVQVTLEIQNWPKKRAED